MKALDGRVKVWYALWVFGVLGVGGAVGAGADVEVWWVIAVIFLMYFVPGFEWLVAGCGVGAMAGWGWGVVVGAVGVLPIVGVVLMPWMKKSR